MARRPRKVPESTGASDSNHEHEPLPALRATAKDRAHPYSIVNPGAKAGDDWSVKEICAAYDWPDPKQVSGGGKIALIHLAGGWLQTDINQFFAAQGLQGKAPTPTDRSLDPEVTNSALKTPN